MDAEHAEVKVAPSATCYGGATHAKFLTNIAHYLHVMEPKKGVPSWANMF